MMNRQGAERPMMWPVEQLEWQLALSSQLELEYLRVLEYLWHSAWVRGLM